MIKFQAKEESGFYRLHNLITILKNSHPRSSKFIGQGSRTCVKCPLAQLAGRLDPGWGPKNGWVISGTMLVSYPKIIGYSMGTIRPYHIGSLPWPAGVSLASNMAPHPAMEYFPSNTLLPLNICHIEAEACDVGIALHQQFSNILVSGSLKRLKNQ